MSNTTQQLGRTLKAKRGLPKGSVGAVSQTGKSGLSLLTFELRTTDGRRYLRREFLSPDEWEAVGR